MHHLNFELKIVHRDLKAANVFLEIEDDKICVKVGDFGHCLNKKTMGNNIMQSQVYER